MEFVANTAILVGEIFNSPTKDTVIKLIVKKIQPEPEPPASVQPSGAAAKTVAKKSRAKRPAAQHLKHQSPPEPVMRNVDVGSHFKLVFIGVMALVLFAAIGQFFMATSWADDLTTNQQSFYDGLGFAWKSGTGAIFGLLGGKQG